MNSGELYDLFRSDVVDIEVPYLWTDTEVFAYMNDAYQMFARLTGGIPDSTSDLTQIDIVTGEAFADVSPLILRFRAASLQSDSRLIEIINQEDVAELRRSDYGINKPVYLDNTTGPVRYMVIGLERSGIAGKVRWVQVPQEDDVCQLSVYRLPLKTVEEGDTEFAFSEVGTEHHYSLLSWMKFRAYSKQDAETFDRARAAENKQAFVEYCNAAKAEWERYKHKTRVVSYGGL